MSDTDAPAKTPDRKSRAPFILELIRKPIEFGLTGAAIVLVLYLANLFQLLPQVFKGAGFEIEFRNTLVNNQTDVKTLSDRVRQLEEQLASVQGRSGSAFTAAAATPNSGNISVDGADSGSQLVQQDRTVQGEGVMWIGTYTPQTGWTAFSAQLAGRQSLAAPAELEGQDITITRGVNIREAFPQDNEAYFRTVQAMGVADEGTRGTILSVPKAYDRDNGKQYWAKVDISYRPYIGE